MKITYCSDLHFEFALPDITKFQDSGDVLLLAGDITTMVKLKLEFDSARFGDTTPILDFFDLITRNYKRVIYVIGNHEYYQSSFQECEIALRDMLSCYKNLKVVSSGELIVIDNIVFVCGTMWTDFNNQCPITLTSAKRAMMDYHLISDATSNVVLEKHLSFVKWVKNLDLSGYSYSVLVTHHSPSFETINEEFKGDNIMNGYFSANCDKLLSKFDYAIHGHQHNAYDVIVNDCQILSNACGYPREKSFGEFTLKSFEV
jgi:Icc-related predicted phosphoesterase